MGAIFTLEWRRLWTRPFAWLLAAVVLAGMALELLLMLTPYLAAQARLIAGGARYGYTEYVLLPWLAVFVFAAIAMTTLLSMGALAGDRRHGRLALLRATGATPTQIVLGKYLALLAWLGLVLAGVLAMALALAFAAAPDWGKLAATALGLALLLATLCAIGLACSAHARHPATAATATLVILAGTFFIPRLPAAAGVPQALVDWLALPTHLQNLTVGLVDSRDLAWFVIVTALALALACVRLGQDPERD